MREIITKRRLFYSLILLVGFLGSSVLFANTTPDLSDPAINAAINAAVQEKKTQRPGLALPAQVEASHATTSDEQSPVVTTETPVQPSTRLWNLQDADILSVINEVSQETGKNFVVDSRVNGKIS